MKQFFHTLTFLAILTMASPASAEFVLFEGILVIQEAFGGNCGDLKTENEPRKVVLGLDQDEDGHIEGWLFGRGLPPGKVGGEVSTELAVTFPRKGKTLSEVHWLSLTRTGSRLVGVLTARPFHDSLDECSIVEAKLSLVSF